MADIEQHCSQRGHSGSGVEERGTVRRDGFDTRAARPVLLLATAAAAVGIVSAPAGADQSDMISEPIAMLQGLDKITARVSEITAPVGKPVMFGSLRIVVRDCEKSPPIERPEDAAFIQIDEVRPGEVNVRRFSGWMFAQSPALSSLEHPVYDVVLLDCKGASTSDNGSPPASAGNSQGNEAR